DEAKKARVEIIVGDKIVVSQADEKGYPSILIESGKEAILQSFHEAYQILEVLRSEARKGKEHLETLQRLRAVLDSVEDQIVILDAQNRIQLCNPAAQRIFRKKEEALKGSPLTVYPAEFLKDLDGKATAGKNHLVCLTGKQLLIDYIPIETRGERSGTLILGRSVDKLQQAERKVRHELHLKGHVARYTFSDIVTGDDHFRKVIQKAKRFSASASTILVQGETGTGKEMFTQSIHRENFGTERPFVAINCATLPEPLLESELFGYAPGAFTGARKEGKKGLFELAHGGTLLLDEISELPLNLQSRLLRVIEEREVLPIGDDRVIPVDIRIIAVTNRDLAGEVRERHFREDLFYRLAVLELKIPPLRERGDDAWELFRHFVLKINPDAEPGPMFHSDVRALLCGYPWPGNVRELRNLVERLSMLTEGFRDFPDDAAEGIRGELHLSDGIESVTEERDLQELSLKELEQQWLEKVCGASILKKKDLAKRLGVSRTTLWKRTRKG
ncbi:MAG: sigma 54-interacting transcriptional regulator, partial [Deltaproteobacteria bacterium]|nr:sigma 54-interacting transcriptional regulator [Deltaproteobacteria bacterium]